MKLLAYIIGNNNKNNVKISTKNLKETVDVTLKKSGMGDSQR